MKITKCFLIIIILFRHSGIALAAGTWGNGIDEPLVGWIDWVDIDGNPVGRGFHPVYPNPSIPQFFNDFIIILYNTETGQICSGVVPVRTGAHTVLAHALGIDITDGTWVGGGIGIDKDGNVFIRPRESFISGGTKNYTGDGYLRDPEIQRAMIQAYLNKTGHTIKSNPLTNNCMPVLDCASELAKNPPRPTRPPPLKKRWPKINWPRLPRGFPRF